MSFEIRLEVVPLERLKPHEKTTEGRLRAVIQDLKKGNVLWFPILVDDKDYIILDGHHRVESFKRLGLKRILTRLVDYDSPDIEVYTRREGIPITKDIVRAKALAGEVFPHKTTRHVYPLQTKHYDEPLDQFK
jgi:ParB-like chromosome segregation protein Spo0J